MKLHPTALTSTRTARDRGITRYVRRCRLITDSFVSVEERSSARRRGSDAEGTRGKQGAHGPGIVGVAGATIGYAASKLIKDTSQTPNFRRTAFLSGRRQVGVRGLAADPPHGGAGRPRAWVLASFGRCAASGRRSSEGLRMIDGRPQQGVKA